MHSGKAPREASLQGDTTVRKVSRRVSLVAVHSQLCGLPLAFTPSGTQRAAFREHLHLHLTRLLSPMTTRHAATGVDNDITGKKGTLPALGGLNLYEGLTRRHAGKDFVVGEVDGTKVRVRVGEDDLVLNTADVRRLLALAPSGTTPTPLRRLGSTFVPPPIHAPIGRGLCLTE